MVVRQSGDTITPILQVTSSTSDFKKSNVGAGLVAELSVLAHTCAI